MTNPFDRIADAWIGRRAARTDAAQAAIGGLKPIAVVTGGSEGIGLAFARRLVQAGHDVALVARRVEPLEAAARLIRKEASVEVVALALDITVSDAAAEIERRLADQGRYIDILVNNAGIGAAGPFAEAKAERVLQLVELNVRAATALMHRVLPGMLARGCGGIINIASLGGLAPGPNQAAYYASKAYLISLSQAVAQEVSGRGVRITCVAPGPANTGFHARMGAENAFYRWVMPPTQLARIASWGYRGYRLGMRLVVPGFLNNALAVAMKLLPHRLLAPILGVLLRPRGRAGATGNVGADSAE